MRMACKSSRSLHTPSAFESALASTKAIGSSGHRTSKSWTTRRKTWRTCECRCGPPKAICSWHQPWGPAGSRAGCVGGGGSGSGSVEVETSTGVSAVDTSTSDAAVLHSTRDRITKCEADAKGSEEEKAAMCKGVPHREGDVAQEEMKPRRMKKLTTMTVCLIERIDKAT